MGGARPAGYSGMPLPRKLGIKPGHAVAVADGRSGSPQAWRRCRVPVWPVACPASAR